MGIFDVNRYKKEELQSMISSFVKKYDFLKMKKKIQKFKKKHIKYQERFPFVYEISEEYYEQFKSNPIVIKRLYLKAISTPETVSRKEESTSLGT